MCPQTVGLIQKSCEEDGIICATISIIDEITSKLNIKRYLSVPYDLGEPLGDPSNYSEQKNTIKKLLHKIIID